MRFWVQFRTIQNTCCVFVRCVRWAMCICASTVHPYINEFYNNIISSQNEEHINAVSLVLSPFFFFFRNLLIRLWLLLLGIRNLNSKRETESESGEKVWSSSTAKEPQISQSLALWEIMKSISTFSRFHQLHASANT